MINRLSDRGRRLAAVVLVSAGLAATQPPEYYYDFTTYHVGGLLLVEGRPADAFRPEAINERFQEWLPETPAHIGAFLYSPVYLLPCALTTLVDYRTAAVAAQMLTLLSLAVLLFLVLGSFRGWKPRLLVCLVFLFAHPVTQQFHYLNWSVHLALFVALAWRATLARRWLAGAIWWALAIHLKPVALLLAVPLLFARCWRLAAATAAVCALLALVALPWVGVESYAAYVETVRNVAAAGVTPFHNKVSLAATAGKLLTAPMDWLRPQAPVAHPAIQALFWIGLAGWLALLARRPRDLERNFGLSVPFLLLFVPQIWDHTEILLVVVFLVPALPAASARLLAVLLLASAAYGPAMRELLLDLAAGRGSLVAARAAFFFYPALNVLVAASFLGAGGRASAIDAAPEPDAEAGPVAPPRAQ